MAIALKLKLTPKRKQVLEFLSQRHACVPPPDHHDIAVACGRPYSSADWAHAPLRELLSVGYVEVVGRRSLVGRLWGITDAGRAALRYE